jgi:hypothetical protein
MITQWSRVSGEVRLGRGAARVTKRRLVGNFPRFDKDSTFYDKFRFILNNFVFLSTILGILL